VSYSDEFSGKICRKCYNSKYLHAGMCVDTCPDGYLGDGTGQFDRRCVEEHNAKGRDGGRVRNQVMPNPDLSPLWQTYSVSGIVATLVFDSAATTLAFEETMLGCSQSLCVPFTSSSWPDPKEEVTLCPHLASQPACDFGADEASSMAAVVGGSMGAVVLLAVVAIVFAAGAKKGTEAAAKDEESDFKAFDNPMYDSAPNVDLLEQPGEEVEFGGYLEVDDTPTPKRTATETRPKAKKGGGKSGDKDVARATKLLKKKFGREPTAAEIKKKVAALKKKRAKEKAAAAAAEAEAASEYLEIDGDEDITGFGDAVDTAML